jgi:RNA polymerase sigma factor (sigma-70 family)
MAAHKPGHPPPAAAGPGGDPVERYLAEIAPLLRRVVASVCATHHIDPGEIEQEVRIRLWRVLSDERNVVPGASYVYRTAATAAIDAVRRVRARREEPLDVVGLDGQARGGGVADGGQDVARRIELRQLLLQALDRLANDRRRAVRLHLRGLTTHEIASALAWTEPKARNHVYRGLADLRDTLRALGVDSAAD